MPLAVDDTTVVGSEVGEQGRGQVKTTVRASRALVEDSSRCGLSSEADGDLLEAVGSRVSPAVLRSVQSDGEVAIANESTASTLVTGLRVVIGELGVGEAPVQFDVSRGPLRQRVVMIPVEVDVVLGSHDGQSQRHERGEF